MIVLVSVKQSRVKSKAKHNQDRPMIKASKPETVVHYVACFKHPLANIPLSEQRTMQAVKSHVKTKKHGVKQHVSALVDNEGHWQLGNWNSPHSALSQTGAVDCRL